MTCKIKITFGIKGVDDGKYMWYKIERDQWVMDEASFGMKYVLDDEYDYVEYSYRCLELALKSYKKIHNVADRSIDIPTLSATIAAHFSGFLIPAERYKELFERCKNEIESYGVYYNVWDLRKKQNGKAKAKK